MNALCSPRMGFFCFLAIAAIFGVYHEQIAYGLDLWGVSGKAPAVPVEAFVQIDRSAWKTLDVSSVEEKREKTPPENAWDGKPETFWHTEWGSGKTKAPHYLAIDLGRDVTIFAIEYLPRQKGVNGLIGSYQLLISNDGEDWQEVASGIFDAGVEPQLVRLQTPRAARFIRINALTGQKDDSWAAIAELHVLTLE